MRLGRPPRLDAGEVLRLARTGLSMREIARQLGVHVSSAITAARRARKAS